MSIASVSNRWLNRLYKILAIMLVLLAVLISALRLFSPYVEHYRQDFQDYVNESNHTNLVIGGLGMNWQRSGPTLIANRVTLLDDNGAYVYVHHLEIQIDFWSSLTTQTLISSNLILDGAIVSLEQNIWDSAQSSVEKENTAELKATEQVNGFKQITDIFLNRINRFSLKNSKISIKNNALERHFRVNNLYWLNFGERHQAQGNITVDELSSNNLNLKIDINGQSGNELEGMVYIEANHLDITPWLDSVFTLDNDNTEADISFDAWLKIDEGSIERLQISLDDNLISWQENIADNPVTARHSLALSTGQLLLVKGQKTDSFKLFSTPLSFQFDQAQAQEFTIQLHKKPEELYLYLSSFDLDLISQVSPLLIAPQNMWELLSQLNINGKSNDIFVRKTTDDISALASFSEVSTQYSQGIPGVENISGILSFNQDYLHLKLEAVQGYIDFNKHFTAPIPYDSLQAKLDLSIVDNNWQLNVNDLALNSQELTLQADLSIDAPEHGDMSMSLLANVTEGDASKAGHYYPLSIMSEELVDYLNESLIDGKLNQAQVLINGPLAKFPFEDKSGTFVVDAELAQAKFSFSKDWPAIENFYANLNFTNNSMLITGRSGTLTGLDVTGVQAAIDDLGLEATLTIDTLIQASSADNVAKLMNNSPLKSSVGSVLQRLQVKGDIQGEFHLNLPLMATEKALAQGQINFVDNEVYLQKPQMQFSQVNGQLNFENEKITTKNLSLNWQDLPLTLTVNGNDTVNYYDTTINLNADWQNTQWLPHLSPNLKKYFDGQLQLQGDLSLYHHHDGGFSYQFSLASDLEPFELKLPSPYLKATQTKVPLKVEMNGQLAQSTINATYGDKLSFFGVLAHDTNHFSRAHIVLGNEKMLLPMDGLHITTNLAQVAFSEWQPLILDIINTVSQPEAQQATANLNNTKPLFTSPERIRGTIGSLAILGQNWHNVSFNLLDKKNWWLLQLNAKETRSQVKIYPDWLVQGIDVNADFINFASQAVKHTNNNNEVIKASFDDELFAQLPKINFYCERCQFDKINFGQVNFSLSRTNNNVIKLDHFKAKREQGELILSGEWQKLPANSNNVTNGVNSNTSINGSLALNNIEYELEQLGYGSIIRDSGGKLNFNLNWQGGPHEFDFSHLNGDVSAKIDDGYLAEVSDKARIFSVLSLQSIVRKLTLDFRDIFSEGMFYKDIKGDYHIKEGVLYTDNTRMNGAAGNLYVKGNTNFVNNALDYKMSYKPNLTSSLPVLAWIATLNPVVFLAGVAIDQVITSQVVSEFNFELTGSVEEPIFKEVNRKSRDVSVGRSKPPEFVDSADKTKTLPQEPTNDKTFNKFKEDPFKEKPPIKERNND